MRFAIKIGSGWVGPHFLPISVELPQSNIPKKNNAKTMGKKKHRSNSCLNNTGSDHLADSWDQGPFQYH
jgi:hypothetical protein